MSIGIWQILLILFIVLILFGAGKVPRLMEDFGKGVNAFKKGLKQVDDVASSEDLTKTDSSK
jgi:sec-independent protein translocase protein TatA